MFVLCVFMRDRHIKHSPTHEEAVRGLEGERSPPTLASCGLGAGYIIFDKKKEN